MHPCTQSPMRAALLLAAVAATNFTPILAGRVQHPSLTQSAQDVTRAESIKAVFRGAYADYKTYAFPDDSLLPLTKSSENDFGGWGATVVDSISTALLMNETAMADEMIQHMTTAVDFDKTDADSISLFETNIRFLGGLLSAYELTGKTNAGLLAQATKVGDHLMRGWVGDNPIPYNKLQNWTAGVDPNTTTRAIIAEAGTLLIEFGTLSRHTGNQTYLEYADKSMTAIVNTAKPFPGLPGQEIDPVTGQTTFAYITWGGGTDSGFEYEIKWPYLQGNASSIYVEEFQDAIRSSVEHLLVKPDYHPELTFLADYYGDAGGVIPRFSHLGCFAGGTWILGGKLLDNDDTFKYGLDLAKSCGETYRRTITGIGPESFVFAINNGSTNGVTISDPAGFKERGFDYDSTAYIHRPEVIESLFYAYRTTGDRAYQEYIWDAWTNITSRTKAPAAYAGLQEVNNTKSDFYDIFESFAIAELMKYTYLTFADPK